MSEPPQPTQQPLAVPTGLPWPAALRAVHVLTARSQTLAVAESLTGGLVTARVVDVAGSSAVLRGGVVAYASDVKHALLGVDAGLLAQRGAVDPQVARQMAEGVRARLGATWGLATTGVAGPTAQDGKPVGTAFVAVRGPLVDRVRELRVDGDRAAVREGVALAALLALGEALA